MKMRSLIGVALPLLLLGACSSFSDSDRAMLNSANQNAEAAKNEAAQATAMARQAQQQAAAAQQASERAAADASAANQKADRMFQRSLRKTSPGS